MYIKTCPKCSKRFDAEKGFYKDNSRNDGYCLLCKQCHNDKNKKQEHKSKNYILDSHLWDEENENLECSCKRCGIKRKRIAHKWKVGKFITKYYYDNEWKVEHPLCKINYY